jgi:hypothetical protein
METNARMFPLKSEELTKLAKEILIMMCKRYDTQLAFFLLFVAMLFSTEANKDKSLKEEWDFMFAKMWEIDSADDEVLGRPQGILVLDNGFLYISDPPNRKNYIFDQDGSFIKSFAKRGEGPEL